MDVAMLSLAGAAVLLALPGAQLAARELWRARRSRPRDGKR
jgi:hypothetical protein